MSNPKSVQLGSPDRGVEIESDRADMLATGRAPYWGPSISLLVVSLVCCYLGPPIEFASSLEAPNIQTGNYAVSAGRSPSRHWTPAGDVLIRKKRQFDMVGCPAKLPTSRRSRTRASITFYNQAKRRDYTIYPGRDNAWHEGDSEYLIQNGLNLEKPMIIYSHGYLQTYKAVWLMMLRKRFSEFGAPTRRYNLLIYDWGDFGAGMYPSAASYVPYLGKVLGDFLAHLHDRHGYKMNQVHLVGYSLSTHIVGIAARRVAKDKDKVRQITAIDPTGVCFHQKDEFAKKYQLQPSDAEIVVAKTYDYGELGPHKLIGGLDILVNGGSRQPFMALQTSGARGLISHVRATDHEVDRFDEDCHDVAYACSSYNAFLAGECGDCGKTHDKCYLMSTMGNFLYANHTNTNYKPKTVMYITTGRAKFCIHHYQIVVKLNSNSSEDIQAAFESGGLSISFNNGEGRISPSHRASSTKFTALMRIPQRILSFHNELDVAVRSSDQSLRELMDAIDYIDVKYMSQIDSRKRIEGSARYRPRGDTLVKVQLQ